MSKSVVTSQSQSDSLVSAEVMHVLAQEKKLVTPLRIVWLLVAIAVLAYAAQKAISALSS